MNGKNELPTITPETWGLTLHVKNVSGGSSATWAPTLKDALDEISKMFNVGDYAVTIIKRQYKDRMNTYSETQKWK